ncbi:phage tail protein [Clostridium botulinum]|uniref:phage tail protein n=1 Tax=Clostridium botulinum TaxID=1491 RepID=UPI00077426E6|nr:phage tail protein [Clostridium botulinum]MBY6932278.1 phage tail protein [Clostridium botulinum]NFG22212.1 phage tail protein [Clostridium botulinum]NFO82696.1 phage tail protein [Clostridium botulinum]
MNTLIWNNARAEDMGVKVISLPPIGLSVENIEEKERESADGTLTYKYGYTSDEKEVECDYIGDNPMKVANWLRGSGKVIFGNLPDRYYKARINNIVPLETVIENGLYNFPIKFKCQPFGYLLEGNYPIEIIKNGTTIYNGKATYKSLPLITVYGVGRGVLTINSINYTITNINGQLSLDSEIQEVLNKQGEYFESDYFPELKVGENNIAFSGGITKVVIVPRWRCL